MLAIHFKILKMLWKKPLNISQIEKHFNKNLKQQVSYFVERMENDLLIEELCEKEYDLILKGMHYDDDAVSGDAGDFTGMFTITDFGRECYSEEYERKFQFWLPFIYSAIISSISVVISLVAIFLSV